MAILTYFLGLITGLILALITGLITLYAKPSITRKINTISSKLKAKGAILEPDDDLDNWVEELPNK